MRICAETEYYYYCVKLIQIKSTPDIFTFHIRSVSDALSRLHLFMGITDK